MFVRFKDTEHRLRVSLVETRRIDGQVKHEHVASLGSCSMPPSVADRVAFWQRLRERLAKLSNRVDATAQGKLLGQIHARIPMVTPDEQAALQLENADYDGYAERDADRVFQFSIGEYGRPFIIADDPSRARSHPYRAICVLFRANCVMFLSLIIHDSPNSGIARYRYRCIFGR